MSLTVGVDVGGARTTAGVVDEGGAVLERAATSTSTEDAAGLHGAIAAAVAELRRRHDVTAVGVAGAAFGAASTRSDTLPPHLWRGGEQVAERLREATGLPVVVENDGNAAAWAEFAFGAGRGVPDQLLVTLGTGVGGGLILDGELYTGGHGVAAEIGHLGLVRDGLPCSCGRRGCLEQYTSAAALERDARAAADAGRAPGLLAAAGGDPEAVTWAMVTELARAGDSEAVELFAGLAAPLGMGIASLVAVLDPGVVLLGGGLSEAGDALLGPTADALGRELTGGDRRPGPELRIATLGNDARTVGVADLARRGSP